MCSLELSMRHGIRNAQRKPKVKEICGCTVGSSALAMEVAALVLKTVPRSLITYSMSIKHTMYRVLFLVILCDRHMNWNSVRRGWSCTISHVFHFHHHCRRLLSLIHCLVPLV